jgi:glycosyltransferase involved in cell wall biosynthesis
MIQYEPDTTAAQLFSIVIPVHNDWIPLEQCLQSLARQTNAPNFEVIVVDDGSAETAPEYVRSFAHSYALTIIRESHRGISAARNRGIQVSKGAILLFVDADCRLQTNCLAALSSAISQSSQHDCFQLRLVGNCSSLIGRAEELRLLTFQDYMLQSNGSIRYLNTAGFAIRRKGVDVASIRSAALHGRTYGIIASKGVRIRITHRERLKLLWCMWKAAGRNSIGRSAWFMLVVRQALQRGISLAYQCLRLGSAPDVTPQ